MLAAAVNIHHKHEMRNMAPPTLPPYQMFWCFILLLLLLPLSNPVSSQTIVKSLPGFSGELPFLLETGYIGVGELDEVQLFYYFFESEQNPKDDPLVLWLPSGPGCSALSAIMFEIGPLSFNYKSSSGDKPVLALNEYSWTKVANIIFLDAPVGTGFSYATTSQGYNTSDTKSVSQIYQFLRKWLLAHSQFQTNQVYIAGDSYSGITVPALVKKILDGQEAGNFPEINLEGYVLGNPFTDVYYDVNSRIKFAHRLALLSDELYEDTKLQCHGDYVHPNKSGAGCIEDLLMVNMCLQDINDPMILEPKCSGFSPKPNNLKWGLSPLGLNISDSLFLEANPIKYTQWCRDYDYVFVNIWANDIAVQEALNVRNGTITQWERCNKSLSYEFDIESSVKYHKNFTNTDLRALVYSGDHDLIIPHVGTEEWIESLNLTVSADYDEWRPWYVDGQVAGYVKVHGQDKMIITFATVKGAGHRAPEYKPEESYFMIGRWFAYYYL